MTENIFRQLPPTLERFRNELEVILNDLNLYSILDYNQITEKALTKVLGDLSALVKSDPSVQGIDFIASEAKGFEAVRYYRYLNTIYVASNEYYESADDDDRDHIMNIAKQVIRKYSESVKSKTQVEIHPHATIGEEFIIDHGTGTVIGEKTTIGKNCMILNDVILGSSFDPNTDPNKRHPTIMDNVKIFSGVRILGNIIIGNNCTIGTKCIIKNSIPDFTTVSIINQLQITKIPNKNNSRIYGIIPGNDNTIIIYGKDLLFNNPSIKIIDKSQKGIKATCEITENEPDRIVIKIETTDNLKKCGLIIFDEHNELMINECIALSEIGGKQ